MVRALPMTIALALVIASGIVHGQWTQRWSVSHALEEATGMLERLPMVLGDWQGRPLVLDRAQVDLAEIAGYVARRYVDPVHNDEVTILLVCGPPGPISVHTPDICYVGAGFEMVGSPEVFKLTIDPSSPPAEFRSVLMSKANAAVPTYLRILWSWSAVGIWEVPQNPRLAFAPRNVLYKLYVIRGQNSADEAMDDDAGPRFLRILLPELERVLVPGHK
jgi:hypothetical protein